MPKVLDKININDPISVCKFTTLHIACAKNNIGAVKMILDKGGDANVIDSAGKCPLHIAAS